jgi:hypothetical protein
MRRAARVDANQEAVMRGLRDCGWKVISTAQLGGGFPDLVACDPDGVVWLLEVKKPCAYPEAELTPMQTQFNRFWSRCNTLRVVTTAQQVIDEWQRNRPVKPRPMYGWQED